MFVTVEREKCSSCAECVLMAPEVFDLDDDDALVVLLDESPGPELYEAVRQSAKACPTAAIIIAE